jgi:TonB family protein
MYTQVDDSGITAPETFGLLPAPNGRISSFVQSLAVNVVLAVLFACLTLTQVHEVSMLHYVNTELVLPSHIPPPPRRIRIPTPRPIAQVLPKLEIRRPRLPLQEPETVRLSTPPMPLIAAPPARVVVPAPALAIKTGGFGDPAGVVPNPNANRPATIAAIGSFENAPGASKGAGGGSSTNGVAGGRGTIATGGFGGNGTAPNTAAAVKPAQERFTPPRVLSEPRPQYTEEAKQLKIQGEVTLQVRFGIEGKVEVLRVVTGLGHGLDEEATRVAERIQFKPAEKNGKPADNITYIHILFQLA